MAMHMKHSNWCGEIGLTIQKMLWMIDVVDAAEIIYVEEPWNKGARSCQARVVACTFFNNPLVLVDRPLCTVPRILLQCYVL